MNFLLHGRILLGFCRWIVPAGGDNGQGWALSSGGSAVSRGHGQESKRHPEKTDRIGGYFGGFGGFRSIRSGGGVDGAAFSRHSPDGGTVTDYFSTERTIILLREGKIVHIQPQKAETIDVIAEAMLENFENVRRCTTNEEMMCCLWTVRQTEQSCIPFVFFDDCDGYRLWQNFMLFDRHREDCAASHPVLLIGACDVFGSELGGKPNGCLGEKVFHLEEI